MSNQRTSVTPHRDERSESRYGAMRLYDHGISPRCHFFEVVDGAKIGYKNFLADIGKKWYLCKRYQLEFCRYELYLR